MTRNLIVATLAAFVALALAATLERPVGADGVDPSNPGPAAIAGGRYAWGADGTCWHLPGSLVWTRMSQGDDLPVAVGSVSMITVESALGMLVTTDGTVWAHPDLNSGSGVWQVSDPFPGGPVAIDSQSWGRTKATHR